MSWADANLNDDPTETLAMRITELEHTVSSQLSELRNEVGLAAAAMRAGGTGGVGSALSNLEEQLARAVTVSLSAALEAIREALTQAVTEAVGQVGARLQDTLESRLASLQQQVSSTSAPQAVRPAFDKTDLENVSASLQHAVLLALSSFELATTPSRVNDPMEAPATARDVARVNQRLDELRSLLLG